LEQKFPYFVAYIQQEIPKYVSKEVLKQGGLTVESTLNPAWQEAAESSVNRLLGSYGKWQRFKQAALVTIDPRNGEIKAMVGGSETLDNQFNRVTQAKRQPGSTFKTFVYTAGIAAGFSPYRSYMDAKYTVDGYKPENYGDKYRNGYLSIKDALSYSVNVIAVQSLIDVGWKPVIDVARKMGIKSELKPTFSLALGASEVNLLELTSAYGTLANKGLHKEPRGIRRIVDRKGKVLYEAKFADEKALDEETTALVTWMLRGVVNYGTGGAANIGRPVAGKTGTSDDYRDLWFVGYIPQLVTGIWLGNDDNSRTWGASSTAAYLWGKFMRKVVDDMPVESFPSIPGKFVVSKPAVKREKIKPKHAYFEFPKKEEEETKSTSERSSNSKRRRRRSTSTESR
jgi:penicillin-binding protein 1A